MFNYVRLRMQRLAIIGASLSALFLFQFQASAIACTAVDWSTVYSTDGCCTTTWDVVIHYTYPLDCEEYFGLQTGGGGCLGGFTNCAGNYVQPGQACPAKSLLKIYSGSDMTYGWF